jgi:hypothetical protein
MHKTCLEGEWPAIVEEGSCTRCKKLSQTRIWGKQRQVQDIVTVNARPGGNYSIDGICRSDARMNEASLILKAVLKGSPVADFPLVRSPQPCRNNAAVTFGTLSLVSATIVVAGHCYEDRRIVLLMVRAATSKSRLGPEPCSATRQGTSLFGLTSSIALTVKVGYTTTRPLPMLLSKGCRPPALNLWRTIGGLFARHCGLAIMTI